MIKTTFWPLLIKAYLSVFGTLRKQRIGSLLALLITGYLWGITTNVAAQGPAIIASPENGLRIPAHGDFRVFVVFAEVDWTSCLPSDPFPNETNGEWAQGVLPPFKDQMFDHVLSTPPYGLYSDYYYQMSFGQFRVQGDYYPDLITMPCNPLPSSYDVIRQIKSRHDPGGPKAGQPIVTQNGHGLDYYDQWTPTNSYQPKNQAQDLFVDMALVVWRNYCENSGSKCINFGSGSIGGSFSIILGPATNGINNLGQFVGGSLQALQGILVHEFNHPLIGGNNWHIAWGADTHAVPFPQGAVGMLASSPTPTNVASAWDRNQLGWKNPDKTYPISAWNSIGPVPHELPSDISIESHPNGGVFMLRDFMNTGDAIRIKLPHIDWTTLGDVKNQYLWLENRQNLQRRFDGTQFTRDHLFDTNLSAELSANRLPDGTSCAERWLPGVHAYIQIGKEKDMDLVGHGGDPSIKDGIVDAADIDNTYDSRHPNRFASYLFPLTADGNFDFYYQLDHVVAADGPDPCHFNNVLVPVDRAISLTNPFTGHSDIFLGTDSDNFLSLPPPTLIPFSNGRLFDHELQILLADFVNGNVIPHLRQYGDAGDAFNFATGKRKLSIATNPAPVPVYTMASNGTTNTNFNPLSPPSYDNRTIWLNGLSIEITNENLIDGGELGFGSIVKIRWDDYRVDKDVRWSGNIVLQNDAKDPLARQSKVILAQGQSIYLDRGLSPTQHVANSSDEIIRFPGEVSSVYPAVFATETGRLFTQPTKLTIRQGTKIHLERNAVLWLLNDSTLEVETGAEIQLEPGAEIKQGPGGGNVLAPIGAIHKFGDLNGDDCVDRNDLAKLMTAIRGPANPFYDLNEDNSTNIADARKLVTFFTNPSGTPCK